MNKLIIFIAVLLAVQAGYSFVVYDITVQDETAGIVTTIGLDSSKAVNYWEVRFQLPEGSTVKSVKDTVGAIEGYSFNGKDISFRTNTGSPRTKEVVTIISELQNAVDDRHNPLKILKVPLAGFENETTTVSLSVPETLLTTNIPFGFTVEKNSLGAKMQGLGPLNVLASFSSGGKDYDNYILFGEADLEDADRLNQVIARIIGIIPPYKKFPVVILPDSEYESQLDSFSAASFKPGGVIFVRESKAVDPQFESILLHETMHAYNDQILNWMGGYSVWFDEGTATYVGYITNLLLNVRQSEIFGEEVRYTEGSRIYILPTRGDSDELWDYYKNGDDWLEDWKPSDSQSSERREFGYALSELTIREHLLLNGDNSLHGVYRELSGIKNAPESNAESNLIVLDALDSEIVPCHNEDKSEFLECLEKVNSAAPTVPNIAAVEESFDEVVDADLLINQTLNDIESERTEFSASNFIFWIRDFFANLFGSIAKLF